MEHKEEFNDEEFMGMVNAANWPQSFYKAVEAAECNSPYDYLVKRLVARQNQWGPDHYIEGIGYLVKGLKNPNVGVEETARISSLINFYLAGLMSVMSKIRRENDDMF
jgi:hypothetical protein